MYLDYKNRVYGLDIIRAIAIIMVLISHSTLLLFPNESNFVLTIVHFFGAIGVDLFFVLSGYLIGGIILKQLFAGKTKLTDFVYFWIRRWFRTLPNYFLVLLLNMLVFYALHKVIIEEIGSYFIFIQNFSNPNPDFFTEAWSLSIEEYAYVIGPFLLFLLIWCFKSKNKGGLFLIVTIGVIVVITGFRFYNHLSHTVVEDYVWGKEIRKVVVYRIDSIYYGFLAAFLAFNYNNLWKRLGRVFFILGIIVFFGIHALISICNLNPDSRLFFFDVLYLPLVSISLLMFFPLITNLNKRKVFRKQITSISVLSYSLYLVNYSLVLLSIQYFIDVENQPISIKVLIFFIYWILSFILAYLLYKYFEKPMTDIRDSKFIKDRFIS